MKLDREKAKQMQIDEMKDKTHLAQEGM